MRDILKPYAAFIEYTIKPLMDDARELLEIVEKNGIGIRDLKITAVFLYVSKLFTDVCIAFGVTFAICYTCLKVIK